MEAPVTHPDLVPDLREDLREADYTVDGVEALLGPMASAALHREQTVPAFARLLGARAPVAVLTQFFILGQSIESGDLDTALPRTGTDGLRALGLLRSEESPLGEGQLTAAVDLRPYADDQHSWWVCSDLSEVATGRPLDPSHVLGVGGASTTLASWTPRPSAARALDLGTGCGVQALHLAAHAQHIVATDISERALAFARFNSALNQVDLDLRAGSMLEPVAGERFDLIVSNPPFVITPRHDAVPLYEYRDAGSYGDDAVAHLVGQIGEHLAPGGIAQLLGNWETGAGEDWRDRVDTWLQETGLDAWVVQREVQDPAEYAETWARDGGHRPGRPGFTGLYSTWIADFARRGIEQIGFGVVTLQRPATARSPWRELEEIRGPLRAPLGAAVLAGVRARTWLAEHDEAELFAQHWRVAPDVTQERIGRPGAPDPAVIQVRQGSGFARVVRLTSAAAAVVGTLDGDLSAAQILTAVAALTDQDAQVLRAEVSPILRTLVADGLLVPSGSPR